MQLPDILLGSLITLLLSNSIFGLSMIRSADPAFRPLLYLPLLLLIIELFHSFIDLGEANALADHSQLLIEFFLLIWMRKKWNLTANATYIPFWSTIAGMVIFWVATIPQSHQPTVYMSYFRVAVCFQVIIIASKMMSQASTDMSSTLLQNSAFLFGVGLIFYYTFSGLTDVFSLFAKDAGYTWGNNRLYLDTTLGIFANLVYLRAFMYIPKRGTYSLEKW